MNRKGHRFDYYLIEMADAMDRILEYTTSVSYHEFTENNLIRDAVIRNFEILGESAKHIPFRFQKTHKHVPWANMLAMRNFIVHEFFDVDDEIIWEIIQVDLKKNARDLRDILSIIN